MPDILIDADTIRSPELRHEIPAAIVDPFLYGEHEGVAFAAVSPLNAPTIAAARPDLRQLDVIVDLGLNDLIASGANRDDALLEIRVRACQAVGLTHAHVPPAFPLATAERLRAAGIELQVDRELFATRRRKKTGGRAAGFFEAAGFATQRRPGKTVMEGFPTALGHGVGLEIHEDPGLGRSGGELAAGDVITIEPFLCRPGFGAVQVEDLLLVTADGAERLSSLPTGLAPEEFE